jgi:hypothetical protein
MEQRIDKKIVFSSFFIHPPEYTVPFVSSQKHISLIYIVLFISTTTTPLPLPLPHTYHSQIYTTLFISTSTDGKGMVRLMGNPSGW